MKQTIYEQRKYIRERDYELSTVTSVCSDDTMLGVFGTETQRGMEKRIWGKTEGREWIDIWMTRRSPSRGTVARTSWDKGK